MQSLQQDLIIPMVFYYLINVVAPTPIQLNKFSNYSIYAVLQKAHFVDVIHSDVDGRKKLFLV